MFVKKRNISNIIHATVLSCPVHNTVTVSTFYIQFFFLYVAL